MKSESLVMARLTNRASRLCSLRNLLAYTLLLGFSTAATIASPLDLTFPNFTSPLSHDPDSRFKLEPHYTNERLPATAILMSTVYLLAEAADLDMNSELDFPGSSFFDDYPSVSIGLQNAKPSVPLPCGFLVWALYDAGIDMIRHNKFVVSTFDVLWKGRITARLRYQKTEPSSSFHRLAKNDSLSFQVSALSNSSSKVRSARSSFTKKRTIETITAPANPSPDAARTLTADPQITINMQFLPNARTLSIGTVFAITLEVLKNNAEFAATARVRSSMTTQREFDATMEIRRTEGPSMLTPPDFEYMYFNRAIRQVPRLMLNQGRFAEVAFQIDIDKKE